MLKRQKKNVRKEQKSEKKNTKMNGERVRNVAKIFVWKQREVLTNTKLGKVMKMSELKKQSIFVANVKEDNKTIS